GNGSLRHSDSTPAQGLNAPAKYANRGERARVENGSTSGSARVQMKRSIIARERMLTVAGLALCLGLATLSPPAQAMGRDTVQTLYSTLLSTMQSGPSLGARGRYARLEPVLRQVF